MKRAFPPCPSCIASSYSNKGFCPVECVLQSVVAGGAEVKPASDSSLCNGKAWPGFAGGAGCPPTRPRRPPPYLYVTCCCVLSENGATARRRAHLGAGALAANAFYGLSALLPPGLSALSLLICFCVCWAGVANPALVVGEALANQRAPHSILSPRRPQGL